MVFSTTVFLFLFLPLFLAGYYLLPFRLRSAWILLASYAFYAWWRVDFLALIVGTTILTYAMGRVIAESGQSGAPRRARVALTIGVAGNLGVLAYFKYFNFGVTSLNALLEGLGASTFTAWEVLLPIGISFYVFQATSYLIDVYRKDAPPARSFLDLAAYIALFPQLIAGPILRYKTMAHQFVSRTHTFDKFAQGSVRFMVGFCKKVLVADSVAPVADAIFAQPNPTMVEAWLGVMAYAVQLYFDFSGYSDMAIGLGLMMGFRFTENFNHPYVATSITDFWRRWHISLSSWLRDYLYIPLGGNRRGNKRTYLNIMMVMLLGGLWHGAAWTFVLWGAWHGGLLIAERVAGASGVRPMLPDAAAIVRTFVLVMIGWVTFRAADFGGAVSMYLGMLGVNGVGLTPDVHWQLAGVGLAALAVGLLLVFLGPWWHRRTLAPTAAGMTQTSGWVALIIPLFLLAVIKLTAETYSPFLYFQF